MRVYVASKFENQEQVRKVHRLLTESGHIITHDWTWESVEGKKGEERERYLKDCATKDYNGVDTCDVFFLINYLHCAGAYTEFGIALRAQKCIVVVDGHHPEKSRNIFFHLPDVHHFTSVEEAVAFVNEWALKHRKS